MDVKFIVFLFLVGLAVYATLRMKPKGPKDSLGKVLGYTISFVLLVAMGTTALPRFLNKQSGNMNNWDPFWRQTETAASGAANAVADVFGMGASDIPHSADTAVSPAGSAAAPNTAVAAPDTAVSPAASGGAVQYVVVAGDTLGLIAGRYGVTVDALKAANNLTGDLIVPDQILQIPVDVPQDGGGAPAPEETAVPDETEVASVPAAIAPATPEPTPDNTAVREQVYRDLAAAKAAGDIRAGEAAVATLFWLDVNDPTAVTANDEIRTARELAGLYDGLANQTDHEAARGVMYGRTFLVIDDGAATLTFKSCNETATVQQVTNDWLRGYTFQIRRCVMSGYGDGAPATGETFTVK